MKAIAFLFALTTVAAIAVFPAVAQQTAAPASSPPEKQENGEVEGTFDTHQRRYVPSNFHFQLDEENKGMVTSVEEKQTPPSQPQINSAWRGPAFSPDVTSNVVIMPPAVDQQKQDDEDDEDE